MSQERTEFFKQPGGRIALTAMKGRVVWVLSLEDVRALRELLNKPGACPRCGGECPCAPAPKARKQ